MVSLARQVGAAQGVAQRITLCKHRQGSAEIRTQSMYRCLTLKL